MTKPSLSADVDATSNPKVFMTAPKIVALVLFPILVVETLMTTLGATDPSLVILGFGVAALFLIEIFRRWFLKEPVKRDVLSDATTSLAVSAITRFLNILLVFPLGFIWMKFLTEHTPINLEQGIANLFGGDLNNGWAIALTLALALIGVDFLYYCAHRVGHRVELAWGSHSVHHSSEHYNPSTAIRISFLDEFWDVVAISALCLLGIGPLYVIGAFSIVLLYQLPLHQTWSPQLPRWYEYLFNTPHHHRIHHAFQKVYIDKNFGGILIIWDRMFGSFVGIDALQPPNYGLTVPVGTYNPLKVLFSELGHIGSKVRQAESASAAFGYVFKEPYWEPASKN